MNHKGIENIKPGDTVFVVHPASWHQTITLYTVIKTTDKQFVAQVGTLMVRFRKRDGMELGSLSSRYYRDHAYPDNPENRAEYEKHEEDMRIIARTRDLLGAIISKIRTLREEDLETIEQIAAILNVEEPE